MTHALAPTDDPDADPLWACVDHAHAMLRRYGDKIMAIPLAMDWPPDEGNE